MENHFKAYDDVLNRIYIKNMQLIRLKEDWYTISGTKYDAIKIKGGKTIDIADQLNNIVEREKDLTALIKYRDELRKVHESEIDNIKNGNKRAILKLFYLDKCTIKQIAYCLKKSEAHIKRLKREAIEEFINTIKNHDTK